MRVLVVAEDAEVRAARARDLERAGHETCAASDAAYVAARVRAERPDALLVVAPGATSAIRQLLSRARSAAEASVPALLLLDGGLVWLRASLPADLAPATVLAASDATRRPSVGRWRRWRRARRDPRVRGRGASNWAR